MRIKLRISCSVLHKVILVVGSKSRRATGTQSRLSLSSRNGADSMIVVLAQTHL